jgi:NADH-quinone oxidoreductase subunit G
MPTLKIDGQEVTVEKGRTVIQACEQLGIDVPRYCYHPGLRIVGSCRMCLVEIEKMPKLQVACNTQVNDGMVVFTQSDKVKEARRSVLEFLLLNHPLDCPVCDRAGECELQNYYLKFAQHDSRMRENKIKKRKAFPIGPHVILDQERCVLCSRCVRFCDEVSKTGELGIFNKGTWSEVNIYPGRELDNNYSGNVVDICPVGALLDRDFRYQMSVWYLQEQLSVCPGCSNGCNIRIHYNLDRTYKTQGRRIQRLKPRFNDHVNKWWMCDVGRYDYRWLNNDRLTEPLIRDSEGLKSAEWEPVLTSVADALKRTLALDGSAAAVIASPQMTNEELYLVRRIFYEYLSISTLNFTIAPVDPSASEDGFLLKKDRNPNTRGAQLILSEQKNLLVESILELARDGRLKFLYILHTDVASIFKEEAVRDALSKVETVIYHGTNLNNTIPSATHVLPAATYAEKEGTFTNFQGRVQRIFPAVAPEGISRTTLEILRDLGRKLGTDVKSAQASEVFAELASKIKSFSGMTYGTIGLSGRLVNEVPEGAVAAD